MNAFNSTYSRRPYYGRSHPHHHLRHHVLTEFNWTTSTYTERMKGEPQLARHSSMNLGSLEQSRSRHMLLYPQLQEKLLSTRAVVDRGSHSETINNISAVLELTTTAPFRTDFTTGGLNATDAENMTSKLEEHLQDDSKLIALAFIMIVLSAVSLAFNSIFLLTTHWCRRPAMTPTLFFSMGVSAVDAVGSLLMSLHWLIFALLPSYGYDDEHHCLFLWIEAFR